MPPAKPQPLQVLICDASMAVSHLVSQAVRKSGLRAQCTVVENSQECLTTLTKHPFSLAFIDVDLENSDGGNIIKMARRAGVGTFFVAMSKEPAAERVEITRSMGVFAHLPKPVNRMIVAGILETFQRISAPTSVLVIDSNSPIRTDFKQALQASIYNLVVQDAAKAKTALALFKSRRHEIVFIDINLPAPGSPETMMRIKALNTKVQFVLVSGDRSLQLSGEGWGDNARHLLHKPFFPDDIEQILHGLFAFKPPSFNETEDNLILL